MGKIQIDILGTSFSAQAAEDDAYLTKLTSYYKAITDSIQKTSGVQDPMKISILAGITLVDELYKEKQKSIKLSNVLRSDDEEKAEKITMSMIEKISGVLD
ncbi:cell division protein ZapA [Treponema sp.]|uniref:cell division protein ZapA n=1 Tax=Treponema sp. TaxID=166 RepID=UPI00388F769E